MANVKQIPMQLRMEADSSFLNVLQMSYKLIILCAFCNFES